MSSYGLSQRKIQTLLNIEHVTMQSVKLPHLQTKLLLDITKRGQRAFFPNAAPCDARIDVQDLYKSHSKTKYFPIKSFFQADAPCDAQSCAQELRQSLLMAFGRHIIPWCLLVCPRTNWTCTKCRSDYPLWVSMASLRDPTRPEHEKPLAQNIF